LTTKNVRISIVIVNDFFLKSNHGADVAAINAVGSTESPNDLNGRDLDAKMVRQPGETGKYCDCCGKPFEEGQKQVPGYAELPTHVACARFARAAYREDERKDHLGRVIERPAYDREPFTDWPNGQGTYD
jgi:hypothetical protein